MTSIGGSWWELISKLETHDEEVAKTGGFLLARTNTESPKLLRQKEDDDGGNINSLVQCGANSGPRAACGCRHNFLRSAERL